MFSGTAVTEGCQDEFCGDETAGGRTQSRWPSQATVWLHHSSLLSNYKDLAEGITEEITQGSSSNQWTSGRR